MTSNCFFILGVLLSLINIFCYDVERAIYVILVCIFYSLLRISDTLEK